MGSTKGKNYSMKQTSHSCLYVLIFSYQFGRENIYSVRGLSKVLRFLLELRGI